MKLSHLATIVLGLILIVLLVPATQFLTQGTINLDLETGLPVGWAIGTIFSLVLVLTLIRLIARARLVDKSNLVILYCMLTVAVPVMNLGLVRTMMLSMQAAQFEYMQQGTSTYRTATAVQKDHWFPVVPTTRGLAYNKAAAVLRYLQNTQAENQRRTARQLITTALIRLEQGQPPIADDPTPAGQTPPAILEAVGKLGVDEIDVLLRDRRKEYLGTLGILDDLETRRQQAAAASAAARARLLADLRDADEFALSLVPEFFDDLNITDESSRRRIARQMELLSEPQRKALLQRRDEYEQKLAGWREQMGLLNIADRQGLLRDLEKDLLDEYAALSEEELTRIRVDFVYRTAREERMEMIRQAGEAGQPDMYFYGLHESLWPTPTPAQKERTLGEKLEDSARQLPWHLWRMPLVMWGLLCTAIFLFLMCLAEWLRRKWIERENLAFPLVEIADNLIRHDYALEMAEDVSNPPRRPWPFNPIFMVGFAIGVIWVGVEAMSHYGVMGMESSPRVAFYDISKEWFKEGALKNLDKVVFILSPIILGIAFLISLEISFSVWTIFILYSVVVMLGKIYIPEAVRSPAAEMGWGAAKLFPYPQEQTLGAALCFTIILLYKSFRMRSDLHPGQDDNAFIPRKLNFVGMIVLPIVVLALLWNLGVSSVALLLVFVIITMVMTIASARARAEAGLPTHHVNYEMAKAPIVFGLTGLSGARAFASYLTIVFLPLTLLFRSLGTLLENMELARRNTMRLRTIAAASLAAFVVALAVGMVSFLIFSYSEGKTFFGEGSPQQKPDPRNVAHYAMWVGHFLGEPGLGQFNTVNIKRVVTIAIGFGFFGLLALLRGRFLRFPLHPLGYLLLLLGITYEFTTVYAKGRATFGKAYLDSPTLWSTVFVAWLLKKLIIKYGGMNTYKKAKPLFIGLVVGSIVCVFGWDLVHLIATYVAKGMDKPGTFLERFRQIYPFTPKFY